MGNSSRGEEWADITKKNMPVLTDTRQTKEVQLEKIQGGIINVYETFLAADIEKISALGEDSGNFILPITLIIKDWNLTDTDGAVLPITRDNVGLLAIEDIKKITEKIDLQSFLKGQESSADIQNQK